MCGREGTRGGGGWGGDTGLRGVHGDERAGPREQGGSCSHTGSQGKEGFSCGPLPVPRTVPVGPGDRLCLALEREAPYEKRGGPSAQLCLPLHSLGRWMVAGTQASWSPQSIINNLLLSKPIRKK